MSEPLKIEGRDLTRTSYLRHNQVAELEQEKARLMDQLTAQQPHLKSQEPAHARRRLGQVANQIETQLPPELKGELLDRVSKREVELREKILEGMPSAAEMRLGPPGALGKHQDWQKKNQRRMQEWKNCALLLARSGKGNGDYSDPDVANFERFRPRSSSLNLDTTAVPTTTYVGTHPSPEYMEGYERTFGDPEARIARLREEIALLEKLEAASAKSGNGKTGRAKQG